MLGAYMQALGDQGCLRELTPGEKTQYVHLLLLLSMAGAGNCCQVHMQRKSEFSLSQLQFFILTNYCRLILSFAHQPKSSFTTWSQHNY